MKRLRQCLDEDREVGSERPEAVSAFIGSDPVELLIAQEQPAPGGVVPQREPDDLFLHQRNDEGLRVGHILAALDHVDAQVLRERHVKHHGERRTLRHVKEHEGIGAGLQQAMCGERLALQKWLRNVIDDAVLQHRLGHSASAL